MSSKWSIPALMAARQGPSSIDPDAQAFIDATGISGTNATAINTLVVAAKANGWWTLCNAIYPMIGGTSTTCKYNLKNPLDTDGAFRLTFTGGWTFASTGVTPNGTTGFADTHIIPVTNLSSSSTHLSYYSRTSATSDLNMGCVSVVSMFLAFNFSSLSLYDEGNREITNASTGGGFLCGTMRSLTDLEFFRNGSSVGTDTGLATANANTNSIWVGGVQISGDNRFGNRECAFATIGAGLSSAIAALQYTDIQNFNTTLARQV